MKFSLKGKTMILFATASAMFATSVFAAPLHPVSHLDWMKDKRIVNGYSNGDMGLDRSISLAEVVAVISRVKGEQSSTSQGCWAQSYLAWANKQGAITAKEMTHGKQILPSAKINEIAKKLGIELQLPDKAEVARGEFLQALGEATTSHITIAHTNDVHGHIQDNKSGKEFGYAKMATLIKEWRNENKNFLLMDAGDAFQGTVFVNQFKGETILPILNELGYAAMAAGNHEFDFGYEQLLKLRDQLKYPMINANVFKANGSNLLVPTFTAKIDGKTFAFLGFVTEETPIVTHPNNVKGLTFKNPVEIAKKLVPELKKEADHVIVVSHVGLEVDRDLAKNVEGIDLIIGGHSHTPIQTPEKVNDTYIVQDWEYGKSLGRVDLYYHDKELVGFSGGLVEYDEKIQADPEIDKMVQDIVKKVDASMNVVIAKTEVDLEGERPFIRSRETNLGSFIADTILEKTKTIKGHEADVALTNGGGIRSNKKAGDITKKDLYTILPFPNTVVVVEVSGEDLKKALENGVKGVEKADDLPGSFPQISGMSFTYDKTKPVGERVVEVKVGGQPLDLKKTYKLATNDFLAAGGDGYITLKKDNFFNTGYTLYEVVEEALAQKKVIQPKVDGRIVELK